MLKWLNLGTKGRDVSHGKKGIFLDSLDYNEYIYMNKGRTNTIQFSNWWVKQVTFAFMLW